MIERHVRLLILIVSLLICFASQRVAADEEELQGVVIGRTGEILQISLPYPIRDGRVLSVRPFTSEPAIAKVKVLSCTLERPYVALAKVVSGDLTEVIAIGSHAYAETDAAYHPYAPKQMRNGRNDNNRFSVQAGAFYPNDTALRELGGDYWQTYRLNYSLVKAGTFDAQLSAEYAKGTSDTQGDAGNIERTIELIPVTLTGRLSPLRIGNTRMFLGAGAGIYHINSQSVDALSSVTERSQEMGVEYTAGLESRNWVLELRYRDVENTNFQGYALTLGARF